MREITGKSDSIFSDYTQHRIVDDIDTHHKWEYNIILCPCPKAIGLCWCGQQLICLAPSVVYQNHNRRGPLRSTYTRTERRDSRRYRGYLKVRQACPISLVIFDVSNASILFYGIFGRCHQQTTNKFFYGSCFRQIISCIPRLLAF